MKCFVKPAVIDTTGVVTKGLKTFGSNTRNGFNSVQNNRCTGYITHNEESTTILKPEWWSSTLVQDNTRKGTM
jgi:hypothetical protein